MMMMMVMVMMVMLGSEAGSRCAASPTLLATRSREGGVCVDASLSLSVCVCMHLTSCSVP
jgi:hypothetical protein